MNTATLIMCFAPLFREDPVSFCYLTHADATHTTQEYCDERVHHALMYEIFVCREFRDDHHDVALLKDGDHVDAPVFLHAEIVK